MGATTDDHVQRQSAKLPLSHFIKKKKEVMSLDNNCLSHSNTQNNEATVKAFKMACLSYKASDVQFEKAHYSRTELIESKQTLMSYCLSKLKHLDLGNLEQTKHQAMINGQVDPKHVPLLPSTLNLRNSHETQSFKP